MQRFLEKYLYKFLPVGYPIDTDPIIICAIDEIVKPTKHQVVIVKKIHNKGRSTNIKIYKNIDSNKIKNKLDKYSLNYERITYDNTFKDDPHLGYYITFADEDVEIEVRLFNLIRNLKQRSSNGPFEWE